MKFTAFRLFLTIVAISLVFASTADANVFALDKRSADPQSSVDIRDARPEDEDDSDTRHRIDENEDDSDTRHRVEEDEESDDEKGEEEEPYYKYPIDEETEEYEKENEKN